MNNLFKNWKTTSVGLGLITHGIVHLGFCLKAGTADELVWNLSIGELITGVGLLFAGDASASAQSHVESQKQIAELQLRSNIVPNAIDSGDTSQLRKVPMTPAAVPPPVVPPVASPAVNP